MNSVLERRQPRALPAAGRVSRRLWELLWLPYWLGSTLPPPSLPSEWESTRPAAGRLPTILRRLDELRGIIWRQRAGILAFRSLWLALAAVDLGLALRVVAHRDVRDRGSRGGAGVPAPPAGPRDLPGRDRVRGAGGAAARAPAVWAGRDGRRAGLGAGESERRAAGGRRAA